jgi:hypothetical protein
MIAGHEVEAVAAIAQVLPSFHTRTRILGQGTGQKFWYTRIMMQGLLG